MFLISLRVKTSAHQSVGDSYDNALVERTNNAYKTELVYRHELFETVEEFEFATFQWVDWYNNWRLHQALDYKAPSQVEKNTTATNKKKKKTVY
ncbi:integrase core domain-containing protein [Alloscardovia macacae]|uniref:integrase core domain-containing protein n=1 Tax=Alloscardovia macacae TaxID=1160091 RepID=UPI000B9AEFC3